MKYFSALVFLGFCISVSACNRISPNFVSAAGVVNYQQNKVLSAQNNRANAITPTRAAGTSTMRQASGKAEVEVDTTSKDTSSFSNEDVSEYYSRSGRVDRYQNDDWE